MYFQDLIQYWVLHKSYEKQSRYGNSRIKHRWPKYFDSWAEFWISGTHCCFSVMLVAMQLNAFLWIFKWHMMENKQNILNLKKRYKSKLQA